VTVAPTGRALVKRASTSTTKHSLGFMAISSPYLGSLPVANVIEDEL